MKLEWAAPERNKGPILDVLRRVLPVRGRVLEIASGSGQHAVHFARHLPSLVFEPSDVDPAHLASIEAWAAEAGLPNLLSPRRIDVLDNDWQVGEVDAVLSSNMVHIAQWECAVALFEGAARHLAGGGVLVIYGPFMVDGEHTAPSNAAFDESLRARDPRWGVRDVDAMEALGRERGLSLEERVAMPANNQMLVFRRARPGEATSKTRLDIGGGENRPTYAKCCPATKRRRGGRRRSAAHSAVWTRGAFGRRVPAGGVPAGLAGRVRRGVPAFGAFRGGDGAAR